MVFLIENEAVEFTTPSGKQVQVQLQEQIQVNSFFNLILFLNSSTDNAFSIL